MSFITEDEQNALESVKELFKRLLDKKDNYSSALLEAAQETLVAELDPDFTILRLKNLIEVDRVAIKIKKEDGYSHFLVNEVSADQGDILLELTDTTFKFVSGDDEPTYQIDEDGSKKVLPFDVLNTGTLENTEEKKSNISEVAYFCLMYDVAPFYFDNLLDPESLEKINKGNSLNRKYECFRYIKDHHNTEFMMMFEGYRIAGQVSVDSDDSDNSADSSENPAENTSENTSEFKYVCATLDKNSFYFDDIIGEDGVCQIQNENMESWKYLSSCQLLKHRKLVYYEYLKRHHADELERSIYNSL
jgi:hypothetical protein